MIDAAYLTQVTPEAPIARRDLVSRWVVFLSGILIVFLVLVVMSEGLVRTAKTAITASGGTCVDWPQCTDVEPSADLVFYGSYPALSTLNTVLITAVTVASLLLVWAVRRMKVARPRPVRLQVFAAVIPFLMLVELVLGLVMAWQGSSFWINSAHAIVALLLTAYATWVYIRLTRPDVPCTSITGWKGVLFSVPYVVVGALSVKGGVVLSRLDLLSDQYLPFGLDPTMLAQGHTAITVLFALVTVGGTVWVWRSTNAHLTQGRIPWAVLAALVLLELVIGLMHALLTMPAWIVVVHAVLSAAIVVAAVIALAVFFPRVPVLALSPGASHH